MKYLTKHIHIYKGGLPYGRVTEHETLENAEKFLADNSGNHGGTIWSVDDIDESQKRSDGEKRYVGECILIKTLEKK